MREISEVTHRDALLGRVSASEYWHEKPRAVPLGKLVLGQDYTVRIENEVPTQHDYAVDFLMVYAGLIEPRKPWLAFLNPFYKQRVSLSLEPVNKNTGHVTEEIHPVQPYARPDGTLYTVEHRIAPALFGIVIASTLEIDSGYLLEGRSRPHLPHNHTEALLPLIAA